MHSVFLIEEPLRAVKVDKSAGYVHKPHKQEGFLPEQCEAEEDEAGEPVKLNFVNILLFQLLISILLKSIHLIEFTNIHESKLRFFLSFLKIFISRISSQNPH